MQKGKRLIDANALKKEIVDFKVNLCPNGTGYFSGLCVAEGMLAVSPTVDAVEVTRCKDCDNTCQGNHGLICTIWGAGTDPDGWCYKGERREENATG